MVGKRFDLLINLIYYGDDAALACLYFLDIGNDLFVGTDICAQENNGHILVDQRNWSVLHFCSGIPFGMDVGNFFQLQRAFQRHRKGVAPAQVEEVAESTG